MRSLVSLLLLGMTLVVLHQLTEGAPLAARATLSLGMLVVLAELSGRLALRWRLPRVSGFVAVGILLGPSWLKAVRPDEADALGFVGDAALALFALRAGLALRVGLGGGNAGATNISLGRYLTASLIVPFALTATVVYSVHRWFPLTVHQPPGDALLVALTLGAFTVVAAPALVWATLADAPGGPLGDAVLRLNVLRDFAAVLLFAVVLVLARPLASAGALHPTAFGGPLLGLGASALAGVLLAWFAGGYRRMLGAEPGVFLVGLGFGAAAAGWLGGAEVTLTALVAGLWLARADHDTAELLRGRFDTRGTALAAVAFTVVGARFDVKSLPELWPWLLLLGAVRAAGLYWGGQWAGRGAGAPVTDALARDGWLGLISQAGLGVFLAAAGRRAFPEWGVSFESFAAGLVALHAVVGPICLRQALARRPALTEGAPGGT